MSCGCVRMITTTRKGNKMDKATLKLEAKAHAIYWGIEYCLIKLEDDITDEVERQIYQAEIDSLANQMHKIQNKIKNNKRIAEVAKMRPDVSKKLIRQAVEAGKI